METVSTYHQTDEQISAEEVLIDAAKQNPAEFKHLYDKYFLPIFHYVARRVESEDIAGDITSTVFANALAKIKSYKHKGLPFSAWLFRIARNEVLKSYRKKKSVPFVEVDNASFADIAEEEGQSKEEQEMLFEKMTEALKKLKLKEVEFIQLRFFENRSFKEIAQILELTENTARVKTYRIVKRLKKLMFA